MNKYFLFFIFLVTLKGYSQNYSTDLNKSIQVKDTPISYLLKAKINPYFEKDVIAYINSSFGEAKRYNNELVWANGQGYEVIYQNGNIEIQYGKSKDDEVNYNKLKEFEHNLNIILSKELPKSVAVSTKDFILNDNLTTYSYKAVFNPHKKNPIYKTLLSQLGEPIKIKSEFKWSIPNRYTIILNNDRVNISFNKNNNDLDFYNRIKDIGDEITTLILNPSPKNVAISTKDYVLNDNAFIFSLKSILSKNDMKTIFSYLNDELGEPNKFTEKSYIWKSEDNYTIDLSDSYLKIHLDKSIYNEKDYEKMKGLVDKILNFINI